MQWTDEALILECGKYAEHAAIVHVFSREHGRFSGLSKAALSSRNRASYQPGNLVYATWKARLPEHMGAISCDLVQSFAAHILLDKVPLAALSSACALTRLTLPERDPHPAFYDILRDLLLRIAHEEPIQWLADYARFELALLKECGIGLDLSACAATGNREELVYVSPKSGRAVSREAGTPYHDRLLPLPEFLLQSSGQAMEAEVNDALRLTGYFLDSAWSVAHHQDLPGSRARFLSLIERAA